MKSFLAATLFSCWIFEQIDSQFMGYPYDYSSIFSGYNGYNPMMSMNTLGMTSGLTNGYGTFGTGMESLYGGTNAFASAYNPYGNGLFNFANSGLFGQNAFGTGFNSNMFNTGLLGGMSNGMGIQQQQQTPISVQQPFIQNTQTSSNLNNGNTMRAYGRRTAAQNFNNNNNNYAPSRVGQNEIGGCGGFGGCSGGGGGAQGWQNKNKKL